MTCARCAQLQEELTALRQELTYELDAHVAKHLRGAFGLSPQQAEILALLYRAKGRFVPGWAMVDAMQSDAKDPGQLVTVQTSKLKARLPAGALLNDYRGGYALSPEALTHVMTALAWKGAA